MVSDLIKEVKSRSNIIDVAKLVGINLNRANKALYPFHAENTPSFSISEKKQIFKCFGCNEKGGSITLVSKRLNLKPYKTAQYINDSLTLRLNFNSSSKSNFKSKNKYKQKNDDETAEMLDQIDYYLDILIMGDEREKLQFLINNKKLINKIKQLRAKSFS